MKASDLMPKHKAYCKHYGQKWVISTTGIGYWVCQFCGKRVSISRHGIPIPHGVVPQNTVTDSGDYFIPPYPVREK